MGPLGIFMCPLQCSFNQFVRFFISIDSHMCWDVSKFDLQVCLFYHIKCPLHHSPQVSIT